MNWFDTSPESSKLPGVKDMGDGFLSAGKPPNSTQKKFGVVVSSKP